MNELLTKWSQKYKVESPKLSYIDGERSFYHRGEKTIYIGKLNKNQKFSLAHECSHHIRLEKEYPEAYFNNFKSYCNRWFLFYTYMIIIPLVALVLIPFSLSLKFYFFAWICFLLLKPPFYYLYVIREEFLADIMSLDLLAITNTKQLYHYQEYPFTWIFVMSHPHRDLRNIYLYSPKMRKKFSKMNSLSWFIFNVYFYIRKDIQFLKKLVI